MFYRLEILIALKKLPIPNKTLLEENKILATVKKWQGDSKDDSSDESMPGTPVLIDESTGLPAENVSRFKSNDSSQDSQESIKKDEENINQLSKKLLENWGSLQVLNVFSFIDDITNSLILFSLSHALGGV